MSSKLGRLVDLLEKAAEKAKDKPPAPKNPNAERFAHLTDSDRREEANYFGSRSVAMPTELRELEARGGKGVIAGMVVRAIAYASKFARHEDPRNAASRVIRDVYRNPAASSWLDNCIEKDLSANIPNEGGYLIPEVLNDQIVDLLYPKVIVMQLGAQEIPMDAGNLKVNFVESGSTATYIGQNDKITKQTAPTFGQSSWRAKKLVSLLPISNDLLKSAGAGSIRVDQVVLRDMLKQMAIRMNKAAFQDDGTDDTPRGLQFETGLTDVTISGVFDTNDPPAFFAALAENYVNVEEMDRPGWAFNHKFWKYLQTLQDLNGQYYYRQTGYAYANANGQASQVREFEGAPFGVTQLIPTTGGSNPYTTQVYFGDWAEFWIPRQGMLEIAASDVAAYNTDSSTIASAYSLDQTVLRVIDRHDMGMRQRKAMSRCSATFNQ